MSTFLHRPYRRAWTRGLAPSHAGALSGALLLVCVVSLAGLVALAPAARAATRFLVTVADERGLPGDTPLRWPHHDAEKVRDVFVDVGGVAEARATILLNPTVDELERALARLLGQVEEAVRQGERVEVVFSYSGHGDAESLHVGGVRYPLATLAERTRALPSAATLVVLDACRQSDLRSGRARGATLGPPIDVTLQREVAPDVRVTLFSSSPAEAAQESDDLEGAFFTHHLVAGLRGAADADADKRVTLAEAWRYAHARTLARSHAEAATQHPEMELEQAGEGELVLSELERARALLELPAALAGDLLLLDARQGRVLFEVKKAAGAPVTLALPTRRVRVQLKDAGGVTRAGEVALEWGGRRVLDVNALEEVQAVAVAQRGGVADATPWIVGASARVTASSFAVPGLGISALVERRLYSLPLFVLASASVGFSESERVGTMFTHTSGRFGLGLGSELFVGALRLAGGLVGGVEVLAQKATRVEAAREEKVIGKTDVVNGIGAGPGLDLVASASLPIGGGLALTIGSAGGVALLPVGGVLSLDPFGDARVGLSWEL